MDNGFITVELIFALPETQEIITVRVPPETNIEQAIKHSGILEKYPQIDLSINKVGIFSKVCPLNTPLRDMDRIEIYRPLIADPKEVRKKKAMEQKEKK